jgi:putative salt-induced outer membrane protein YdiY
LTIVDSFTIARKTTSLAFNYGIQFYKKHFVLDINLGAGVKYRAVKHYDRILDYKGPREVFDLHRSANVEGKRVAFHLPINLQLGYRF